MRISIIATLCLTSLITSAQSLYIGWQAKPIIHTIEKKFEQAPAVFVKDNTIVEYKVEKEGFFCYKTIHRIIHVNNDKGIEMFNKVYLPFDNEYQMLDVKARTLSPSGEIKELDNKNIKEIKEEERTYKIFALDGLVKNSEVEYTYTIKMIPSFFGREIFTEHAPVMDAHFELIAPDHLFFEMKSYNQLATGHDTTYGEKRHLILDDHNLDEVKDEKYSLPTASLKRVDYRLSYNKAKGSAERMFTWNELAKKAYDIYATCTEKDLKKAKDVLKETGINDQMSAAQKIITIERYIKKNFRSRDDISSEDAKDLSSILKNKVCSEMAVVRLYSNLLTAAGIDFQIVLCGNRENYTIDQSFENWNAAHNLLLYFPATKKFLAPTEAGFRYPWIPPTWGASKGLFCVGTTIGNFATALGEVRMIPLEQYEKTYLNMNVQMDVDAERDSITMQVKQIFGGYASSNYRIPFIFSPKENERLILKELIKYGTNSENITGYSFENLDLDQADPYTPFIINATIKSSDLIEKAGNKILVKVGEIIFQQAEMYDADKRTTPVDLGFPHALSRKIDVNIPKGYVVKNLNDLNFNQVLTDNGTIAAGFVCSYTQEGNKIKITVNEDYKRVSYPIEQYDAFKKIINTAADFNKVVLVLEKAN